MEAIIFRSVSLPASAWGFVWQSKVPVAWHDAYYELEGVLQACTQREESNRLCPAG